RFHSIPDPSTDRADCVACRGREAQSFGGAMAEGTGATAASGSAAGKMTMVVGVDESEHSYYALQWTLLHFFSPGQQQQYRLVVVTAKPTAASAVGLAGPGARPILFPPSRSQNWRSRSIGFVRRLTGRF
uniref:UspA domain-containing protein n=1 Tax=Aegilops tauschii subsp. strangulata TaxID=200361 RepID=A0A453JZZ7_AEGTS